jgi:hypothetical protein
MGIMDKGKAMYESNTVQLVLTGVTVGMAIFSMVNAIIAFSSFQAGKVFHFLGWPTKDMFLCFCVVVVFFIYKYKTIRYKFTHSNFQLPRPHYQLGESTDY